MTLPPRPSAPERRDSQGDPENLADTPADAPIDRATLDQAQQVIDEEGESEWPNDTDPKTEPETANAFSVKKVPGTSPDGQVARSPATSPAKTK